MDRLLPGNIPEELGRLPKLKQLLLGDNRLSEVSMELLETFRALGNRGQLAGNSFLRPPLNVVEMGYDQGISWWKDLLRFGEGTSNKLKVVLVGLAEAGKTTVARNMTKTPITKRPERTVGIEITDNWQPTLGGPLEISVWDFAGQADYFSSHQLFITKGSLFLLVVDLHALFIEASSGVQMDGDRQGRVYRWLEMLHLRVPEAAVALVGTHTDVVELQDPCNLDKAKRYLQQLIARYRDDKAKERENMLVMPEEGSSSQREAYDTNDGEESSWDTHTTVTSEEDGATRLRARVNRQDSTVSVFQPPLIYDKVFTPSLDPDSTAELVQWIGKAATGLDCPAGFSFPGVGATLPTAWIEANSAMDSLKVGRPGKRYVMWSEAVNTFKYYMEAKGSPIDDPEDVLLRAMRHREAEGGVLLCLDVASGTGSSGILYLDPAWLIELVRRMTDHNLLDEANQDTLKKELQKYGEQHRPRLDLNALWKQHRAYRSSGTLDVVYLRFLWMHRTLGGPHSKLNLSLDEFNSMLATMEALLVLYRAPAIDGTKRTIFVVPARLPEYGDEKVLENGKMSLGDFVVRTTCSFRRSYSPPGLIGRFLAFANSHISEARECWQHGAHLVWTPGEHDVLVYEAHSVERSDGTSVAYPGLVLCVKGNSPAARETLRSVTLKVQQLFGDAVHGYPGLCSVVFEDTEVIQVRHLTSDLRTYLDNRFDQLGATMKKVAGVTSVVLEAVYLAAEDRNQYPRLLVMKPAGSFQPDMDATNLLTLGGLQAPREAGREEGSGLAAAGGMQRETWAEWINAFKAGRKFRLVFICEHDLTEVKCGPGGKGYYIDDMAAWLQGCLPLLKRHREDSIFDV